VVNPVLELLGEETFDNYRLPKRAEPPRGSSSVRAEVRIRAGVATGARSSASRGLTAGTFQHECDHLDGKLSSTA